MSDKPVIYTISHTLYYSHRRAIEQMISEGKYVAVLQDNNKWDRYNYEPNQFAKVLCRLVWLVDTVGESDLKRVLAWKRGDMTSKGYSDYYTIVEMGDDY